MPLIKINVTACSKHAYRNVLYSVGCLKQHTPPDMQLPRKPREQAAIHQ